MRLIGFKKEDRFWLATLESLAGHFGVSGHAQMTATVVDPEAPVVAGQERLA